MIFCFKLFGKCSDKFDLNFDYHIYQIEERNIEKIKIENIFQNSKNPG